MRRSKLLFLTVFAVLCMGLALCFTSCNGEPESNDTLNEEQGENSDKNNSTFESEQSIVNNEDDAESNTNNEINKGNEETEVHFNHTIDDNGVCTVCKEHFAPPSSIEYSICGDHAEVLFYTGTDEKVIISETYKGLPVTRIGNYAFSYKTLTSITIPKTITSIANDAFISCDVWDLNIYIYDIAAWCNISFESNSSNPLRKNLYLKGKPITELTIPSNVTKINDYAFSNCESLKSVTILDGVTNIGAQAFYKCINLTSVKVGNDVSNIGGEAFRGCESLTSVTIGNNVKTIDDGAFCKCKSLVSITLPDSVTSLGEYVFGLCTNLSSITVGNNIQSIGYEAFYGTKYYDTDLNWENDVLYIGKYLIQAKTNVSGSYIIKDGTITISEKAFLDCRDITNVKIPNTVTSIDSFAFNACYNLTSITIPDSVTSIGSEAFKECSKLVEVINKSSLNITTGSDSHGKIAYYAKEVHDGISKVLNENDFLFYTYNGANYLLGYLGSGGFITLPDSYNEGNYEIYQYAFYNNENIIGVTISKGVTNIGEKAFYGCYNLTNVELGNNITNICDYAFYNCYRLVEVINKSNLQIERNSTNYGHIAKYALEVHAGSSKINKLNDFLFFTNTIIYGYDFSWMIGYVGDDTVITLPDNYNGKDYSIKSYAFYMNHNIISVTIPDGVTWIEDYAFYNCSRLSNLKISDSVESICEYSFASCYGLTSVTIGSGVTEIEDNAFTTSTDQYMSIYYNGTVEQWDAIEIHSFAGNATIYYYSATQPTTTGKYWRYVDGVPTPW